jgi:hypothetical protein
MSTSLRPLKSIPFYPISVSPISGICDRLQISILEILSCMSVVEILAFLELEQK